MIVLIIDLKNDRVFVFKPCFYFIFWQMDKHVTLYKNVSVEPKDLC